MRVCADRVEDGGGWCLISKRWFPAILRFLGPVNGAPFGSSWRWARVRCGILRSRTHDHAGNRLQAQSLPDASEAATLVNCLQVDGGYEC